MKSIILAAGYATRLWPLTKDKPKPLLEVKGKPIVEHIIKKIEAISIIDEIFIVTNDKFFRNFLEWNSSFGSKKKITIVNDKTFSNDDRLGSLGDIKFVVENIDVVDDVMVVAGDNLFEFSLIPVMDMYAEKKKAIVALYDVKDIELAKQYGIVAVDSGNKIVDFEEKPQQPKSTLSSTGIYVYPKTTVEKLIKFVDDDGKKDKAGDFLEWMYKQEDVYCYVTKEKWFDIGTLDQLEKAKEEFGG
ncbi:MAG: nucleotidyltransferase family protein [Nanoarchaeota archaeon]|nr:nucleotidyltransferase family protein [Nanoarchaeota archaeon]